MNDVDSKLMSGRAEERGQSGTEVEIPKGTGHLGMCSWRPLTLRHSGIGKNLCFNHPEGSREGLALAGAQRQPAPFQNHGHVQGEMLEGHIARPSSYQPWTPRAAPQSQLSGQCLDSPLHWAAKQYLGIHRLGPTEVRSASWVGSLSITGTSKGQAGVKVF